MSFFDIRGDLLLLKIQLALIPDMENTLNETLDSCGDKTLAEEPKFCNIDSIRKRMVFFLFGGNIWVFFPVLLLISFNKSWSKIIKTMILF